MKNCLPIQLPLPLAGHGKVLDLPHSSPDSPGEADLCGPHHGCPCPVASGRLYVNRRHGTDIEDGRRWGWGLILGFLLADGCQLATSFHWRPWVSPLALQV
jgi:hypothetical protein